MEAYNKLVRDNIPDIIRKNGEEPIVEILDDVQYKRLLSMKLLEEVNEYIEDENIEELADVYEVFLAILKSRGIEMSEVEKMALEKRNKRGAFDKKIYLKQVK